MGLKRIGILLLATVWILALLGGSVLAEGASHVQPGAFGESFDALDDQTKALCASYADKALEALKADAGSNGAQFAQDVYLQVVQTTVLLLDDQQPPSATMAEKRIWDTYYNGYACVVSFVVLDNLQPLPGAKDFATHSGSFPDYAVRKDGTIEAFSLKTVGSRNFASPIVPGMRIINLGDYCDAPCTVPAK